jgi:hypothetical protein
MKTLDEKFPIEKIEINGTKCTKFSFSRLWERAWYWMDKWEIPIEDWQKNAIADLDMSQEHEPSKSSMIYFITQRCENLKEDKIPNEIKPMILEYKIEMMNLWGWPDWGYKDIKHLKTQRGPK